MSKIQKDAGDRRQADHQNGIDLEPRGILSGFSWFNA